MEGSDRLVLDGEEVDVTHEKVRLLLVRLDHMGDVVLTVPPVVHSLRASYPEIEVDVLTTRAGRVLLSGDPAINRVLAFDPPWSVTLEDSKSISRSLWSMQCWAFWKMYGLRGPVDYDWVVYLSWSPWERILTRFWSARRLGFSNLYQRFAFRASTQLLTHSAPFDAASHTTDNALELVDAVFPLEKRERCARLVAGENLRRRGHNLLRSVRRDSEQLLIVHGGTDRSMKAWPLRNYLEVATRLESVFGLQSVFVGRPHEIRYVSDECKHRSISPPALLETVEIEDLVSVAIHARLFLSNDGGPMHVAAALGVPTLGVFGPTDERVFGPRGPQSYWVREAGICGRRHYPWHVATCCGPTNRECLRRITPDTVFKAASAVLAGNFVSPIAS